MSSIDSVTIDLAVVLGSTTMPVHQLLRMGRGAVIGLNSTENDPVLLLANNTPVAEGTIVVENEKISLAITRILPVSRR